MITIVADEHDNSSNERSPHQGLMSDEANPAGLMVFVNTIG